MQSLTSEWAGSLMEMKLKTIESEKYNVLRKATHESGSKDISDHIPQMTLELFCIVLRTHKRHKHPNITSA